jgi:hypothetical protein
VATVNVGQLIGEIGNIEFNAERGRHFSALIGNKAILRDSIEFHYWRQADSWNKMSQQGRSRVNAVPGANRIEAICRDKFGDAKCETLKRLRDHLSIRLDCEPAAVAAMSLEEFLAAWKGDTTGTTSGKVAPSEQQAQPVGRPRKGVPRATVNARMIDELQRNPESANWSCRKWAERMKCVKRSVEKTAAWKMILQTRAANKDSQKSRSKRRYDE